jgi:protein-tyrosine phosphatase
VTDPFAAYFGTWRGAIRLALSYAEVASGRAKLAAPQPDAVKRLVFVCHGNICRSAYAQALARRAGLAEAGFGLSTSTGNPAWGLVQQRAELRGLDLSAHRATSLADFEPRDGDYLLGMEVRHMRKLAADPRLAHLPRGLLGYPAFPHLHDPYKLNPAYMDMCLDRIESAVNALVDQFPNARCD